ncbi:DNA gyrase inhibitor YacG [Paracoccus shanxieyensis]|uniref:DNA gyrase inhibitor YacG n=1 Tax=Paracoccus shanxieyensis TaxID=2675752 RepID=A0A6L6ITQ7_9RHOB|nr:DNA gyrase inhibitor YacG [Paracoccus shanxieyensis]MTH63915.1 DNA gyrase inhibitor YacG [Paracoccus shanxieyensis]MTH86573.1 DNA gyrase inhibitor YacG [Paracoccus shanxieyensis]
MACPICGKPAVQAYRPFCSRRCADVDLAHWLRGDYRIPGEPLDDPDAALGGAAKDRETEE